MQQAHPADDDIALHGLAHVVNNGCSGLRGHDGFHLHAGIAHGAGFGLNADARRRFAYFKADVGIGEAQRMSQGNNLENALGSHDAADYVAGEYVALWVWPPRKRN